MDNRKGWEEDCVRSRMAQGHSKEEAERYCWGAKQRVKSREQVVAELAGLYGEQAAAMADALFARHADKVDADGALHMTACQMADALMLIESAHYHAGKPAAWVHECIRRYVAQGLSEEEAAQRCYGAYHNRGGRSAELPEPPADLNAEEQQLWLET